MRFYVLYPAESLSLVCFMTSRCAWCHCPVDSILTPQEKSKSHPLGIEHQLNVPIVSEVQDPNTHTHTQAEGGEWATDKSLNYLLTKMKTPRGNGPVAYCEDFIGLRRLQP